MTEERTPPTRVRITGLQEAQLPALVALEAACAAMYHEIGFDAAEVPPRGTADLAKLPREHDVLVAEADHVVAGYLAWRDEAPGVAYIEDLSVHPDFQRFGVGRRLLDAMREKAREHGIGQMLVKCWTRAPWAAGFYKEAGFAPVDDAAPPKARAWRDEKAGSGRPVTRPGEALLWAPIT